MVHQALEHDLDVFCEKPFVLELSDGERLVQLAESKGRVTQVGYYYRFIGPIQEAARVVRSGALGTFQHVRVEAYGPVVLRPTGGTWRSSKSEGGGALHDYACHAIDVVNFVAGVPDAVSGVVRHGVFSREVEDEVYCSLHYANGASGQMSTKVTVWGTNGRVTADRQECQIYLRAPHAALPDTPAGWTVRYTTELSKEVWFYLRGEEYSDQIDYFVQSVKRRRVDGENNFRSALQADRVASMIMAESAGGSGVPTLGLTNNATTPKSLWAKIFG
jgi:predicted dehydrogenase